MKTKNCEVCNKEFSSIRENKKTCSGDCHRKRVNTTSGRLVNEKISTGNVGAMSELFVSADLLKKGYAVFRSLSPACFCDLIVVKDNQIFRVEVKTGYLNENTNNLSIATSKYAEKIDWYGVYERNTGIIYYLDNKKKFLPH